MKQYNCGDAFVRVLNANPILCHTVEVQKLCWNGFCLFNFVLFSSGCLVLSLI